MDDLPRNAGRREGNTCTAGQSDRRHVRDGTC